MLEADVALVLVHGGPGLGPHELFGQLAAELALDLLEPHSRLNIRVVENFHQFVSLMRVSAWIT